MTAGERGERRVVVVSFVAAVAMAVADVVVTGHAWEDWYITFRHSRNFVDGHGLTFNPGERIHGFTSPLNTFLPAIGYALSGTGLG